MANTADISRGMILKLDGSLYSVVEFGENKTARAAAKVWAKLKGVDNSRTIEKTWNSGDTIFPVRVEKESTSIFTRMKPAIILWTTAHSSK
ncbi:hypothetical protein LWM68_05285 [Niabella sp. W65]|nr:hypothetical protein [Niabella sp. W65]MCH7362228.1 hypothetical protein [Niabella sp. W65]ULT45971.1 hypothetical protein KRR40_23895 [Niabella sp. I65]